MGLLAAAVLVWIMIPGIGFLYAGLARRHHSLALVWQSLMSVAVVTFQWYVYIFHMYSTIFDRRQRFFWGYSLTFSHSAGAFIGPFSAFDAQTSASFLPGDLANFGSKGVLAQPSVGSSAIPDILFYLFQLVFASATAMIVSLIVS